MGLQKGGLKTWSALAGNKKRPSEYEIVTYKLLYRNRKPDAAYEQSPDSMMNQWYQKHVRDSPLQHPDWDSFRDPDQVTYRSYTTMQDAHEEYVDGLIRDHSANEHDAQLPEAWLRKLALLYTPQRYLFAASQMAAAYVVQMAPASTIVNCAAFQEADAFRWMSRVAFRTHQLSLRHSDYGFRRDERKHWEEAPAWQGMRELMEKTLATYDWAENLFALNVVTARAIDETLRQLARAARGNGDTLTAMLCDAQQRDAERSRRWTSQWLKLARENELNDAVLRRWSEKWNPLAERAIENYCAALEVDNAATAALQRLREYQASMGIAA